MSSLIRCCSRLTSSARPVFRWGVQNAKSVQLLPESLTIEKMHEMEWKDIIGATMHEVSIDDLEYQPLFDQPPDKILGIGLNYLDHLEEQNVPVEKYPQAPVVFNKFPSTIVCNHQSVIHPSATSQLDYEVELAVIIGKGGKNINESGALNHVFGYTVANDITARDWQKMNNRQWILAKSMDTFCPLGPGIRTKEFITNPHNLDIKCEVNGEVRQSSNTSNLLFKIPQLIAYISKLVTLKTGDIILTGTPGGVGAFRDPPMFLKPGDTVKCTIDGIGELTNSVIMEDS